MDSKSANDQPLVSATVGVKTTWKCPRCAVAPMDQPQSPIARNNAPSPVCTNDANGNPVGHTWQAWSSFYCTNDDFEEPCGWQAQTQNNRQGVVWPTADQNCPNCTAPLAIVQE